MRTLGGGGSVLAATSEAKAQPPVLTGYLPCPPQAQGPHAWLQELISTGPWHARLIQCPGSVELPFPSFQARLAFFCPRSRPFLMALSALSLKAAQTET